MSSAPPPPPPASPEHTTATQAQTPAPTVETAHRQCKDAGAAHCGARGKSVQNLEDAFVKVHIQDGSDSEDGDEAEAKSGEVAAEQKVLESIDAAKALMDAKQRRDKLRAEKAAKLPLLHPGQAYTAEHVACGFRVLDGYDLSFSSNGGVRVGKGRHEGYAPGLTRVIIQQWADGGIPWMYWTDAPVNEKGETLRECVIRYGMGGWKDAYKGLRCKYVYLDDEGVYGPTKAFILAMEQLSVPPGTCPVMVKGNENRGDVVRIYRSAVPDEVQKVISLRELINIRDAADGVSQAGWWFF
tara:strand:- start:24 stop:917 length:894 start_codon:yes stop_codon:yes gene_type:complete